ncbi:MAG: hypothetical protein ACKOW2_00615 [Sphingobacteriaceae bacterium]
MKKEIVLASIADLPDEFSIDEVVDRLIFIEKVEKGLQEVKEGKTNSEEEAKAKLNRWLS